MKKKIETPRVKKVYTNENERYDDKEGDSFFVGDFGNLSIHEEEIDEFIF